MDSYLDSQRIFFISPSHRLYNEGEYHRVFILKYHEVLEGKILVVMGQNGLFYSDISCVLLCWDRINRAFICSDYYIYIFFCLLSNFYFFWQDGKRSQYVLWHFSSNLSDFCLTFWYHVFIYLLFTLLGFKVSHSMHQYKCLCCDIS